MKLLFEIERVSIEEGGAGKMLVWLANNFADHGHEVIIFTHKKMTGKLFDINPCVRIITKEPNGKLGYPVFDLRNVLKQERPDAIISFMLDSNLYCLSASIGLSIPVIVCERNNPYINRPLKFKIVERLCRFADGATFQLESARDYYSWLRCKTCVIPNPIIPSRYSTSKSFANRTNVICNSARLNFPQKRQDVLIKAFAIVLKSHPYMQLHLYGDGKDISTAKNLVRSLALEDNVVFKGLVKDPIQYIVDSKLFVLSSDFEGISNALAEALAAGMTCISTDTEPGGSRLLIKEGENGYIVPRGDAETLAEKIIYCLDHPEVCDELSQKAIENIKLFSEDKIYHKWETFVNEIVNDHKNR